MMDSDSDTECPPTPDPEDELFDTLSDVYEDESVPVHGREEEKIGVSEQELEVYENKEENVVGEKSPVAGASGLSYKEELVVEEDHTRLSAVPIQV